jgi:hypothetical protein
MDMVYALWVATCGGVAIACLLVARDHRNNIRAVLGWVLLAVVCAMIFFGGAVSTL